MSAAITPRLLRRVPKSNEAGSRSSFLHQEYFRVAQLDTNIGNGTFSFGEAGAEEFRKELKPLSANEAIRRITIPRDRMEREGYHFYTHGDFYFAIDWNRGHREFWLAAE